MMALRSRLGKYKAFPALVLILACIPVPASTAGDDAKLLEGLAKFALDTGDATAALRYTSNLDGEGGLIVRARAMMVTGSSERARELLEQLVTGHYYRGHAALLLADLAIMAGGNADAAREHLETASNLAHGEARQQALYRLAERRREAGEIDRAGQVLASMEPGYWSALGYMNMAADYGKRDLNPSRALVALRVALAMSKQDPDSKRNEELKSRLLVRAGYLAYQNEDHDKAISFLEKVPLESYSTPQGLYLHGLALAANGNHRAAMQSWHRAKKFPLAFPGVANAWLGTGRGYDLSGYLGQAGEAYLAANASFESERVTLRKLADQIRRKGAYRALVKDARDSNAEWFLADSRTLTQPRSAYLLRFMEQARAQVAVRRIAELEQIGQRLARHEASLEVFRGAVRDRLGPVGDPAIQSPRYQDEIEALSQRVATLNQNATSAAQQTALRGAADTLADLALSFQKLGQRLNAKDRRLTQLLTRLDSGLQRIREIRARTVSLQGEAETALDEIALAYVKTQDDRMASALGHTEQQIAHLYEYLALRNIERGEP